jgi:GNAT superfamily N-acetyltransferase
MAPTITPGYLPGAVGRITTAHALYYHAHWGFDASFETQVGRELSDFVAGFRAERDGLWLAFDGGTFVGSIAIDGRSAPAEGARLRWFIVEPAYQGAGTGAALIRSALEFCDGRGYPQVYLWTFKGLDTARRLYERFGFVLRAEHEVVQWGRCLREQQFVRQPS